MCEMVVTCATREGESACYIWEWTRGQNWKHLDIIFKCSSGAPCSDGNESSGSILMAENFLAGRALS